jgi:cytochrome P450
MSDAHAMDPTGSTLHADATTLRERGAACPVTLPDGVPAMIISRYRELRDFLADPKVAKDARHFAALRDGLVPKRWPLTAFAVADDMNTADGDHHRRLRGPATKAFTPRRVAATRPCVEKLGADLLAALPGRADADGVVDLREEYAYPLPMGVICELLGVGAPHRARVLSLSRRMASTSATAREAADARSGLLELLGQVVRHRRAVPRDDLTSALIAAGDGSGASGTGGTGGSAGIGTGTGTGTSTSTGTGGLSDAELTANLLLLLVAGHETTVNLIVNAVRALCGHPDQLALVLAGEASWNAVVEETLRWDGPVANFPFRYPITDLTVDGTPVPRGTAVLAGYAAAGRDPREYGPDADRFDITRPAGRHLAFGHGAHYCLGAPLARLEAVIALRSLYAAHPDLTLAVPDTELPPLRGFVSNSAATLPVRLGRSA